MLKSRKSNATVHVHVCMQYYACTCKFKCTCKSKYNV